jgi:hypothetical protein
MEHTYPIIDKELEKKFEKYFLDLSTKQINLGSSFAREMIVKDLILILKKH